jgi:hypothetical protein
MKLIHVLFPPLDVLPPWPKKKRSYDSTWKFQVEWVTKLPWAKFQVDYDGCVHIVKCKVFFEIEQKDKFIALKWDSFLKNDSCRKASKTLRGVKKGEWYMVKDCKHAKNETTYACKGKELVLQ